MDAGLIAAALVLALAALAALVYARRAWLLSAALERQFMDTRAQQAEQHRENLDQARVAGERLEAQIGRVREETMARLDNVEQSIHQLDARIVELSALKGLVEEVRTEVAGPTAARIRTIADAVEMVTRKPLYDCAIDTGRLETRKEDEVIKFAQSLAVLRPLVPYPKWRFDADWSNPDMAFLLRKRLWEYFRDRKREAPIPVSWHHGTRLTVYLSNDLSRQIYIAGCIDPNEFAFLDRYLQRGMTFLDAGANEGVYTVFAAQRVGGEGIVWAFEPSRREVARLEHNLELNHLSARVFPLALAEREGTADLRVPRYEHQGLNTLGSFVQEVGEEGKETVRLARLDDIVAENPLARLDVIKMDVEGAELRLLQGAEATLRRFRPLVLLEMSDRSLAQQGASREIVAGYLRNQDYELYLFDPYSGVPALATPGSYSDNMIASPRGRSLPDTVYVPWPA